MSAMRTDACMLLTGKEEVVRTLALRIHTLSGWRHGPFTIVDCARPGETVERELFGLLSENEPLTAPEPYPRLAQAGTILLQNVGRLPPILQARIAERLVHFCGRRRPGSRRLMASTSEPLLPRVLDGTFDDRLFYRLNVIHFVIPGDRNTDDTRGDRGEAEAVPVETRGRHALSENRAVAP
jgi:DNA-binding NtrC family response regulator